MVPAPVPVRGLRKAGRARPCGSGERSEHVEPFHVDMAAAPALTETDVAASVAEGRADVGLGIAAVAHQFRLGFVPLIEERYDLAIRSADFTDPAVEALLEVVRSPGFRAAASALPGYSCPHTGEVVAEVTAWT